VHFSVALLSVAAVLHLASHFVSKPALANQWTIVARWNLWIGIGLTLITVAAGWYAYYTVDHDAPSHAAMTVHRNWAMVTLVLFLGIAGWEYHLHRHAKGKGWLFTGLLVVAATLLVSTAWHGGELVYRYGLGVKALPKSEGAGHAHEHGAGQGHDDVAPAAAHEHNDAGADQHHDAPAASEPEQTPHAHPPGTPPH
jgi:uncharacterized membrane protein